ncbi:MAG: Wadjet anti-phage system protein JetD domain-containing protein [Methylobacter sp.]
MNTNIQSEIALIERLLSTGLVREAKWWDFLRKRFSDAGWIELSKRKGEWHLLDQAKRHVEVRLNTLWATRVTDLVLLQSNGLNAFNPKHLAYLPALRADTPKASNLINRRTWYSISGVGPKEKSLVSAIAKDVVLTHDALTRFRPNVGLEMEVDGHTIAISDIAHSLGEFSLSERGLRKLPKFKGILPSTIITVENLGSYIDLPLPSDMLAIFSPGTDIRCAVQLMKFLPNVNWIHFGDIDPEGIKIAHTLAVALTRQPQIYIPSFAEDYLKRTQKRKVVWQETYGLPFLVALQKMEAGIFQEIFMLDERLGVDIDNFARLKARQNKGFAYCYQKR